ncbi:hypothetical protein VOLCADRAFT_121064, partial [Volvox carteri f. nagariensis]
MPDGTTPYTTVAATVIKAGKKLPERCAASESKTRSERPRPRITGTADAGCDGGIGGCDGNESYSTAVRGWVVSVLSQEAKRVKDALKTAGLLDNRRRGGLETVASPATATATGDEDDAAQPPPQMQRRTVRRVLLPVTDDAAAVAAALSVAEGSGSGERTGGLGGGDGETAVSELAALMRRTEAQLLHTRCLPPATKAAVTPARRLSDAITELLRPATATTTTTAGVNSLPAALVSELLADLPSRWERLGDLALLPGSSLVHPGWLTAGGVTFQLDVTRCMFSSGNVTERTRMGWGRGLYGGPYGAPGGQPGWAVGETVVDLYCGIGYYTVPLLVVAGVAKPLPATAAVIASSAAVAAGRGDGCASNPSAAGGAAAGPVSSRCEVLRGDCRLTAPGGVADRVLLGLLPSSRGGWEVAVRALKPDAGGWLHLHHNVTDSEEAQWLYDTMDELRRLAAAAGRDWELRLHHVERVKWRCFIGVVRQGAGEMALQYAPHIRHIVMDIECRPVGHGSAAAATAASSTAAAGSDAAVSPMQSQEKRNGVPSLSSPPPPMPSGSVAPYPAATTNNGSIGSAVAASARQGDSSAAATSAPDVTAGPRWYEQPYDNLRRVRRIGSVLTREVFERDISPGRLPVILEGEWAGWGVRGTKRVLLWPPSCHDVLHASGSSSPVTRISRPDLSTYPRFADCPPPLVADLGPGDVLFLPSLWFHNVTATGTEMSVSVNVFWRHLPPECYHRKDLYGNRDLVQVSVHVSREPNGCLDFVHKNFAFRTMTLYELLSRIGGAPSLPNPAAASSSTTTATTATTTTAAAAASAITPGSSSGGNGGVFGPDLVPPGPAYGDGPEVLYLRSIGENPRK